MTQPIEPERRHTTTEYSRASEAPPGSAPMLEPERTARAHLTIDIVTLFPAMFASPFSQSMIARAVDKGLVEIAVHDLRKWATDRHRTTDDYSFGGGGGMVMKPEPVFRAVEELLHIEPVTPDHPRPDTCPIVLMSPQGVPFTDAMARELASHDRFVILCGRYEGFDERIRLHLPTHEISVGDFVVTGGELPAMLVADAVTRMRPGVLGLETGADTESFADGLLEHPHYTRPANFRGFVVPDVLVGGHHEEVARWRRRESLLRTFIRRPDLLARAGISDEERRWLADQPRAE